MSAPKARNITAVSEINGFWCADVEDVGWTPVAQLNRPDLLKAAKIRFPETAGNRWFKVPSGEIVAAITTGEIPAVVTNYVASADTPSDKQLRYLDRLGYTGTKPVTKAEASALIDQLVSAKADPAQPVAAAVVPAPAAAPVAPAPAPEPAPADLVAALRAVVGPQQLDEAEVRAIVDAHVSGKIEEAEARLRAAVEEVAPRRIEVQYQGELRAVDGHTHAEFQTVVTLVAAGLNVVLVGEAGSGKSTLAYQAFASLGLESFSISVGPTTPTSKFFGYQDANGNTIRTPLREAWEHGHGFLVDEVDNGHPGLLAELNQLLAGEYAAFPDGNIKRHPSFRLIATANTFGRGGSRVFVGRNQLDAAFLDRFATVEVNVDEQLELAVARGVVPEDKDAEAKAWVARVQRVRKAVAEHTLPIVVSPRASIEGAKLLAAGLPEAKVAEVRLFAGVSSEHRKLIDK